MKTRDFVALLSISILLTSCNPDKVDTKGVKEEMDKYKIKRIMPGEILSQAETDGLAIVDSIQNSINRKLDSSLSAGNFESALASCMLSNTPTLAEFENKHEASISRAGFPGKLRASGSAPDTLQEQVLDGYKYNMEKGLPPVKDVSMNDAEIIFNNPILLNTKTCLRCHGMPGKDIPEKEYALIRSKYPEDKSVGFKLNDPMGVWTVRFKKDAFVRNMK